MSGNGNNPIYPLLSTWITTSNEVIWLQNISNFTNGLKIAILAIFLKLADWLDWPIPVSVALHFCSEDYFFYFLFPILIFIYFFRYETIARRSTSSFGLSDPGLSSVLCIQKIFCQIRCTKVGMFLQKECKPNVYAVQYMLGQQALLLYLWYIQFFPGESGQKLSVRFMLLCPNGS